MSSTKRSLKRDGGDGNELDSSEKVGMFLFTGIWLYHLSMSYVDWDRDGHFTALVQSCVIYFLK